MDRHHGFRHRGIHPELDAVAERTLAAVKEVRRELGAGLLEDIYRLALVEELRSRGLGVETKVRIPVPYKGRPLARFYEMDVLVETWLVLELKAVDELHPIHEAQVLTYMRLARKPLGYLVNFNAIPLGTGIRRYVFSEYARGVVASSEFSSGARDGA